MDQSIEISIKDVKDCECGHVPWAHWNNGQCAHCDCKKIQETYRAQVSLPSAIGMMERQGRQSLYSTSLRPPVGVSIKLARDLYQLHIDTGISLDNWKSAREFVEFYYGPISENGV
jgi:hypothetical protein